MGKNLTEQRFGLLIPSSTKRLKFSFNITVFVNGYVILKQGCKLQKNSSFVCFVSPQTDLLEVIDFKIFTLIPGV